jgi:hypothetical protein
MSIIPEAAKFISFRNYSVPFPLTVANKMKGAHAPLKIIKIIQL